jgi:guanylate kinase
MSGEPVALHAKPKVGRRGLILILSSPSGAGKTTLTRSLVEGRAGELSISVTTRQRRPSEIEGRHYHFIDRDQFLDMRDRGDLLEWARCTAISTARHVSPWNAPSRPART